MTRGTVSLWWTTNSEVFPRKKLEGAQQGPRNGSDVGNARGEEVVMLGGGEFDEANADQPGIDGAALKQTADMTNGTRRDTREIAFKGGRRGILTRARAIMPV